MSLNWSLGNIKDYEQLCWRKTEEGKELKGLTEALIHATMAIGLNEITEKNIDEFFWRNVFCQETGLSFLRNPDGSKRGFSYAELRQHIGLMTNATRVARKSFIANRMRVIQRDVDWLVSQWKEKYNERE
jgi:hypothetical protein